MFGRFTPTLFLIWYLFCRPSATIRSPPKSEHSIYWSCAASNYISRMKTLFLSWMFWVGSTYGSFMLQSLYIISSYSKIITFITLLLTTILYSRLWTYESFMLQPLDIILSYSRTTKFVTLFPTAILCSRLWLFTYYFYMSSLSGGFRNFIHCDHYENLNYTKFN